MSEVIITKGPEQIVDRVRPGHDPVRWIEGGDNRHVLKVGNEVFRFPKEDESRELGRYEFAVLKLLQGRLTYTEIPQAIELAPDGSYNVLSFLDGVVLGKQAVKELPHDQRYNLGVAISEVINELNNKVSPDELAQISTSRPLARNRDSYYATAYEAARQQDGPYAAMYRETYERVRGLRPEGSASNVVVFGDLSPANIVLSGDYRFKGLIDWTELGTGDIHNELRPVFAAVGPDAFDGALETLNPALGPVNAELIRLLAAQHELAVLVAGKQKGQLTPEREQLATDLLNQWLPLPNN